MEVCLSRSSERLRGCSGYWALSERRPTAPPRACPPRLLFPAQADLPLQRAPGMEVDRELDRGMQALPPVITDLPAFGRAGREPPQGRVRPNPRAEQRARAYRASRRTLALIGSVGRRSRRARKRRPKPLLRVADPRPRGSRWRGVALGPTPRTCLEEVGCVGEVVVDGQPVHP